MSREPCAKCGGALEPRPSDEHYCEVCRALPCFGCGKPWGEHDDELRGGVRPRMPCIGLKRWYRPRSEKQGGEP